jgi:hypothetical protein
VGFDLHDFPVEEAMRAPFLTDQWPGVGEVVGEIKGEGSCVGAEEGCAKHHRDDV